MNPTYKKNTGSVSAQKAFSGNIKIKTKNLKGTNLSLLDYKSATLATRTLI